MPFQIKRIYEEAAPGDGHRILVDRLWPRGVSKERAALDEWDKEVSPSPELREWFDHRADRFDAFAAAYEKELTIDPVKQQAVAHLRALGKAGAVTLLYGAKDPKINHAIVLQDVLEHP